ncbi:hypothetical protein BS47DRAFT_1392061 [Hydnum rufescens UP504]|uniref:Uncharacterized protein n=1 Tax=Hydnum rufescens UP504 TaxID=1448309 RepID=A0A9P6B098_9AGAM|nr:hypothetical protein BS47DRAFT_1392061 [Hydnum rufescens UP504]
MPGQQVDHIIPHSSPTTLHASSAPSILKNSHPDDDTESIDDQPDDDQAQIIEECEAAMLAFGSPRINTSLKLQSAQANMYERTLGHQSVNFTIHHHDHMVSQTEAIGGRSVDLDVSKSLAFILTTPGEQCDHLKASLDHIQAMVMDELIPSLLPAPGP